jgi:signal transduction histidine kinase
MNEVIEFFQKLGDSSDWPPRWHCGRWSDFHGWLMITADLMIWSAYFCIPLLIIFYVVRRQREGVKGVRLQPVYLLFASFILACGTTHFFDAVMFWVPVYRVNALVRLGTGLISWTTVVYLVKAIPTAFALKPPELLEAEIALRREAEGALMQRAKELQDAQRVARMGSWVWDVTTDKIEWSEMVHEIWELPAQTNFTLERFMQTVHPGDRTKLREVVDKALKTGVYEDSDFRILTPSGRVKHIQARGEVQHDSEGRIIRLMGTDQDVTRQKALEAEIVEKNRMLEEAQSIARLGYWSFDARTGAIHWSDEMYNIFGIPKGSLISFDTYLELLHPSDRENVSNLIQEALRTGHYPDFYHRILTADSSSQKHLFARGEVMRNESGEVRGMRGTAQDVTTQRVTELQMQSKSKQLERTNAELESFAYVASHDLQEPLRKVLTFSSMLREELDGGLSSTAGLYLDKIDSSTTRMKRLIQDILEFSRLANNPDRFSEINLELVAKEVLADFDLLLEETRGTVNLGPLPRIEGVPAQLEQLFQNLIGNALKFRQPDVPPVVSITGEIRKGSEVPASMLERIRNHYPIMSVQEWDEFQFCHLVISDNGIGFEPEFADRIFTLFQRLHGRTTFDGTGIGLAVCRKIASNHHGAIRAEGKPGEGARFDIVLPVTQAPFLQAMSSGETPSVK